MQDFPNTIREDMVSLTTSLKSFREHADKEFDRLRAMEREVVEIATKTSQSEKRIDQLREDISKALTWGSKAVNSLGAIQDKQKELDREIDNLWKDFRSYQDKTREDIINEERKRSETARLRVEQMEDGVIEGSRWRWGTILKVVGIITAIIGAIVPIALALFSYLSKLFRANVP